MVAGSIPRPAADALLLDRYRMEGRIGRGGMAEVYRGKLTRMGGFVRDVAVKVLLPQLAGETEFVNMLMDEARIAATINHPNVVQVIDVGQEGETFYLVMEYVDGTDLRAVEKRHEGGKVPLEPLLFIVAEVLRGLDAIHGALDLAGQPLRVVHRDVTPSNVLITRSGMVKISDFGIAHATGRLTHTQHGAVKGKTRYMSPEQLEGTGLDQRSDLFAVGVVFLEALLGRSGADAWQSTGMGPIFRLPARIPPGLPEDIDRILRRALHDRPDERYPSASTFRRDVLRALHARVQSRSEGYTADDLSLFIQAIMARPEVPAPPPAPMGKAPSVEHTEPEDRSEPSRRRAAAPTPAPSLPPRIPAVVVTPALAVTEVAPPVAGLTPAATTLVGGTAAQDYPTVKGDFGSLAAAGGQAQTRLMPQVPPTDGTATAMTAPMAGPREDTTAVGSRPGDYDALAFPPLGSSGDAQSATVVTAAMVSPGHAPSQGMAAIPPELLGDPLAAPLLQEGYTGVSLKPRSPAADGLRHMLVRAQQSGEFARSTMVRVMRSTLIQGAQGNLWLRFVVMVLAGLVMAAMGLLIIKMLGGLP